jgi:hypothetical protein
MMIEADEKKLQEIIAEQKKKIIQQAASLEFRDKLIVILIKQIAVLKLKLRLPLNSEESKIVAELVAEVKDRKNGD